MARLNATVLLSLCVVLALLAGQSAARRSRYYSDKVQNKVRQEVEKAIERNPSLGPAFVRMVFHDCWVTGCDASVLLEKTPTNGANVEKNARNNIGLAGFEVINDIKKKVGPYTSCADVLVFAGRDAADILSDGNIFYDLTGGRMDGVVSNATFADATLPEPTFDFTQLKNNFAAVNHGFDVEDLVVLSGAHSIGVGHLSSYKDRLAGNTATPIDPKYQAALNKTTPLDSKQNPTFPNNPRDASPEFQEDAAYDPVALGVNKTRGVLDNSYYHNNLVNKVLFKSDWELNTDRFARGKLREYRDNATEWNSDFADAMRRLSNLQPPKGSVLEIRTDCRVPNQCLKDPSSCKAKYY